MGNLQQLCAKKPVIASERSSLSRFSIIDAEAIKQMRLEAEQAKKLCPGIKDKAPGTIKKVRILGRGTFGKVYLISMNEQLYAMKTIKKRLVIKSKSLDNLMYERFILSTFEHPFMVKMHTSFQDDHHIYFVLDFVQGGELFHQIQQRGRLNLETTSFFIQQLILILEFLHNIELVYRDLKPENILIAADGYIRLTDFGLAKHPRCTSFCGTPEYIAPEIVEERGHSFEVDIWALGCLTFELLYGRSPFEDKDQKRLFVKICTLEYKFPPEATDIEKELITSLLRYNPNDRISISDLKKSPFFRYSFEDILAKKIAPPFLPLLTSDQDTRNFPDQQESLQAPRILTAHEQELFEDF